MLFFQLKEIVMISKQDIIETNKKILEEWLAKNPSEFEAITVNQTTLDELIDIANKTGNNEDFTTGLIKKSAYLMGGIAWAQPFGGGNKRTGILCAATFLFNNGYLLELPEDYRPIRKLLYEIQEERTRLNPDVMDKIIFYISRYIIEYEPKTD